LFIVGELQNYSLLESERDVIADAFETFIGHALKGGQGQFLHLAKCSENDKIIDPACGSGGFLTESLKYVWKNMDENMINWVGVKLINPRRKMMLPQRISEVLTKIIFE
jgi:type I restriction-modification system DNA methylase subunit